MALAVDIAPDIKSLGFWVRRGRPAAMPTPHAHTDIEANYLLAGSLTYLHGGKLCTIKPGEFALFWAGIPHRLTEMQDNCQIIWLVLPLAWYMQWQLPEVMTQQLLRGEMVCPVPSDLESAMDEMLFCRWAEDLSRPDRDIRRIVVLEAEARLRRLARQVSGGTLQQPSADDATGSHAQRLAAFMTQHYREDLSTTRIAAAAGLHPNYAMQLFRKRCGMSLWEYLTRLRISHAQRLLLTTDWKVQRIAMESGFASPSRFYEAFSRISECKPKDYRCGIAATQTP
jgi:AraC family transcriptional regulator, melibiose operon regulatory protein